MTLQKKKLSRVKIKGYKSMKECDLSLRDINVMIGSNGAGKSNFVSAFSLLQNVLARNLQVFVGQNGMNTLLYNGRKFTDEISFEVFFGLNSYGFDLIPTDDQRLIFKKEYFRYHGDFENESNVDRGHSESKWDEGVGNGIDAYVVPILKEQSWRVYHFHDTGRNAKVKQEHNISNCKELFFDAANLAAFLYRLRNHYTRSYNEIIWTVQLAAPYFDDFVLEPQEGNEEQIILKWKQKGCEDIFNASQLSDGTLRFICLTVLLLQPKEFQPTTIIIDEPELGLHPYAISLFAEMIRKISNDKQVIISTQSVEMLNEFEAEDVIVAERTEEGSRFKRLDKDDLEVWLKEDYALGDLWRMNLLGGRLSR